MRTILVAAAFLAAAALPADAKLRVGASIPDLASIAARVGGEDVEVFSIARATNDVHRVEVLPSSMVKVSRARLYLTVGLGLDAWAQGILDGSRNARLEVLDCSVGIPVLDKPARVDASMGDVHPQGNPHYWLDPRNGKIVARAIAARLARIDPPRAAAYAARAAAFEREVDAAYARQKAAADALPARTILAYHASWPYFANAFGLTVAATAEPVPGIPPTGRHLQQLVQLAREKKIRVFLQEPYFSDEAGRFLAREAGVRVVKASPSCDGVAPGSYLAHFDALLAAMAGGRP